MTMSAKAFHGPSARCCAGASGRTQMGVTPQILTARSVVVARKCHLSNLGCKTGKTLQAPRSYAHRTSEAGELAIKPANLKSQFIEFCIKSLLLIWASFAVYKVNLMALAARSLAAKSKKNVEDSSQSAQQHDSMRDHTVSEVQPTDSVSHSDNTCTCAQQLALQAAELSLQSTLIAKEVTHHQDITAALSFREKELQHLKEGRLGFEFANIGSSFDVATVRLESDREVQQLREAYLLRLGEYAKKLAPVAVDDFSTNALHLLFIIKREEVRLCQARVSYLQAVTDSTCARVRVARLQQLPKQPRMRETLEIVKGQLVEELGKRMSELDRRMADLEASPQAMP